MALEPHDVTSLEQLPSLLERLTPARELAVDVEADSMHHFRARLCWVQVASDEAVFLVDTLTEVQPVALAGLFGDAQVTKYFHAAQGDLAWLAEAGVRVRGVFDTHRAATLLGWPKNGLADLVLQVAEVTLDKQHQQADFSVRPLPPELRAYIADDVRYLCQVGRAVREACRAADILEEVELDCRRAEDQADAPPDESALNVKLPREGLSPGQVRMMTAVAERLHALRLKWAEAADVPLGRMLSNMALQSVATRRPATVKELSGCPGVRGAVVREHGEEVLRLVREVAAEEERGALSGPAAKGPRDPAARRREEALLAFRKQAAEARKVTPSVVLPNALVLELAQASPRGLEELEALPYFGPKRLALYGEAVLKTLARVR